MSDQALKERLCNLGQLPAEGRLEVLRYIADLACVEGVAISEWLRAEGVHLEMSTL